jgi:hypothetical protein
MFAIASRHLTGVYMNLAAAAVSKSQADRQAAQDMENLIHRTYNTELRVYILIDWKINHGTTKSRFHVTQNNIILAGGVTDGQ